MQTLTAIKRSKTEKLSTIRNNGMVPSVVYGAGVENTMISVPSVSFEKVFKASGESSTIVLELTDETSKGAPKKIDVLIYDVQVHPVKGYPIHIDFLAVDMNKPIEVEVPLEFTGIAPAEKNGFGTLVKVIHEIEVESLPKDLPHSIIVDVSTLVTLEDQIHAKDIILPKGVTLITNPDEVIALVTEAKEEKEEAPVDLSAIEVEKKGKKEDAEEAPESK
jgi:large subunit ribosomal protein L25